MLSAAKNYVGTRFSGFRSLLPYQSHFTKSTNAHNLEQLVPEVLEKAQQNKAEMINLMFTDLYGTLQQTSIPVNRLDKDLFEKGVYFDGSSIRGWQPIQESDMILIPDPTTAFMDPFTRHSTISFLCDTYNPDGSNYSRDPRWICRKAEENLKNSGIADHANVGPECEFFIFDNVSFSVGQSQEAFYSIDSDEGHWTSGRRESRGYKARKKEGYFPAAPFDRLHDIRLDMVKIMDSLGLRIECAHHEVGSGGQCEIDFRYGRLTTTGDKVVLYKYIVRNVAYSHNKTATFMPKPLYGDNGSGMHQHYSLHDEKGKNLFSTRDETEENAGLSELALHFVGGIIKHSQSLLAITNPTTNSYKRLVPGYEAPIYCVFSPRNRSAFIRVPISPVKARRIEFRTPDPLCNPYLAFAAILQAGLDGIINKYDSGLPVNENLYELSVEEIKKRKIQHTPTSLQESLHALENDHDWLLRGNVFTKDFVSTWIDLKQTEVKMNSSFPTPYEFHQYFDA